MCRVLREGDRMTEARLLTFRNLAPVGKIRPSTGNCVTRQGIINPMAELLLKTRQEEINSSWRDSGSLDGEGSS